MHINSLNHHDLVNLLSGVAMLTELGLERTGNRSSCRPILLMLKRAADRILQRTTVPVSPTVAHDLPRLNILLLDDNPLALVALEHELRSWGMVVFAADGLASARRMAELLGPAVDVVIASREVRRPDGESVVNELVACIGDPVVVYTSTQPVDDAGVIEKPVDATVLHETLSGALERTQRLSGK